MLRAVEMLNMHIYANSMCIFDSPNRVFAKQFSWYLGSTLIPVKEVFQVKEGSSIEVNRAVMTMQAFTGAIIKRSKLNNAIMEAFGNDVARKRIKVGSRIGGVDKRAAVYPSYLLIYSG